MKKILWIVSLILMVTILYLFILIIGWSNDNTKCNNVIKEVNDVIDDFSSLKNINSDFVGIIRVKGTKINYPFVRSFDNSYYMNHSFDKSYNKAGWIFLDNRSDLYNLSRNNIIYGHGRYDGTMFGSLKNVLKKEWLSNPSNYVIEVSLSDKTYLFKTFSVYIVLKEDYYIKTIFTDKQFATFIDNIVSRSEYNFNENVFVHDKILTLSTCYSGDYRMVLHAKLIKTIEN